MADALRASIIASKPDHIAFTGDIMNLAGRSEFPQALQWLKDFADPLKLSFTPGNHDAYVPVPWQDGLELLSPWMKGDRRDTQPGSGPAFPYVRLRRNVALIGLNSGIPQPIRKAGGTLGAQQLRDLGHHLDQLAQQGFYRVVMIHHPPLPGLAPDRRALADAEPLRDILQNNGCELVLHGHNHITMMNWLETKTGACPVIGVPSASITGHKRYDEAAWNLYRIRRHEGRWQTEMTVNRWNADASKVEAQTPALLLPP